MSRSAKKNNRQLQADKYAVQFVPVSEVKPSPENDDIYGAIGFDDQMENLVSSIRRRGLEEPIIVSADGFIISGHRRYFACQEIGLQEIPIRRKPINRAENLEEWHRTLIDYNPQRSKTVATLLKEALLKRSSEDPRDLIQRFEVEQWDDSEATYCEVEGEKQLRKLTDRKGEFLQAVKNVVYDLREYWPLTVRQIHYNLLNDPPLTQTPKRSKFDLEHFRYRNTKSSYDKLVNLLTPARYAGEIPMQAIDDPTRPKLWQPGYGSLSEFLQAEVDGFLTGYHIDKQLEQPRHIEVLGEKGTLFGILKPVCQKYYIPLSLGKGYSSVPVFREISRRFRESGKPRMTLIVVSDYDPEGLDLADDAIRTLRDLWSIPIDYHRVGVNREQIELHNLATDFNPAKETSSRLQSFIKKTGGTETWEVESLPPDYLRSELESAIRANMDMQIFEKITERESDDAGQLHAIREQLLQILDV